MAGMLAKTMACVLTATAMAIGPTAVPARADVDLGAVTSGPLFGLAQLAGVDTFTIQDVDVVGDNPGKRGRIHSGVRDLPASARRLARFGHPRRFGLERLQRGGRVSGAAVKRRR